MQCLLLISSLFERVDQVTAAWPSLFEKGLPTCVVFDLIHRVRAAACKALSSAHIHSHLSTATNHKTTLMRITTPHQPCSIRVGYSTTPTCMLELEYCAVVPDSDSAQYELVRGLRNTCASCTVYHTNINHEFACNPTCTAN